MEFLAVLAVLAAVVLFVTRPLWRDRGSIQLPPPSGDIAELEAARDSKYREIREAELDLRTGKLSQEDFDAVDQGLRAEAVEILHELDAVRERLPSPRP